MDLPADDAPPKTAVPDATHRLQAAALWRRWRARRPAGSGRPNAEAVPAQVAMPPPVWRHYRHFSWVVCEQRLMVLILGFLLAGCGLVWTVALHLRHKPPLVVRAAPSLKEEAISFSSGAEISYDQLAFFLNGCLPLLYAVGADGHPLLPLAQGLVAPEIYDEAEHRLNGAEADVRANEMTQSLTLTGLTGVTADSASGRAAAYIRGYLTVTVRDAAAQFFPWRAKALLEANPASRLDPYPFYLLRLDPRVGPAAAAWDRTQAEAQPHEP